MYLTFPGGLPAPQTPWTWRSGAKVPCSAGPIVAKVPSSAQINEKQIKKREDIKGTTYMGGRAAEGCLPPHVCGGARSAPPLSCLLFPLSFFH